MRADDHTLPLPRARPAATQMPSPSTLAPSGVGVTFVCMSTKRGPSTLLNACLVAGVVVLGVLLGLFFAQRAHRHVPTAAPLPVGMATGAEEASDTQDQPDSVPAAGDPASPAAAGSPGAQRPDSAEDLDLPDCIPPAEIGPLCAFALRQFRYVNPSVAEEALLAKLEARNTALEAAWADHVAAEAGLASGERVDISEPGGRVAQVQAQTAVIMAETARIKYNVALRGKIGDKCRPEPAKTTFPLLDSEFAGNMSRTIPLLAPPSEASRTAELLKWHVLGSLDAIYAWRRSAIGRGSCGSWESDREYDLLKWRGEHLAQEVALTEHDAARIKAEAAEISKASIPRDKAIPAMFAAWKEAAEKECAAWAKRQAEVEAMTPEQVTALVERKWQRARRDVERLYAQLQPGQPLPAAPSPGVPPPAAKPSDAKPQARLEAPPPSTPAADGPERTVSVDLVAERLATEEIVMSALPSTNLNFSALRTVLADPDLPSDYALALSIVLNPEYQGSREYQETLARTLNINVGTASANWANMLSNLPESGIVTELVTTRSQGASAGKLCVALRAAEQARNAAINEETVAKAHALVAELPAFRSPEFAKTRAALQSRIRDAIIKDPALLAPLVEEMTVSDEVRQSRARVLALIREVEASQPTPAESPAEPPPAVPAALPEAPGGLATAPAAPVSPAQPTPAPSPAPAPPEPAPVAAEAKASAVTATPATPPTTTSGADAALAAAAGRLGLPWPLPETTLTNEQAKEAIRQQVDADVSGQIRLFDAAKATAEAQARVGLWKTGDTVEFTDGRGRSHRGTLTQMAPDRIKVGGQWVSGVDFTEKMRRRLDPALAEKAVSNEVKRGVEANAQARAALAAKVTPAIVAKVCQEAGFIRLGGNWYSRDEVMARLSQSAGAPAAVASAPAATEPAATHPEPPVAVTSTATKDADVLPPFSGNLIGPNPVRIVNPNVFAVRAGIRSGKNGRDLDVPANGVNTVSIPDGRYDIYFVYSYKPDALFQGDPFTLNGNGVQIRIVKVAEGNYGIRQVK